MKKIEKINWLEEGMKVLSIEGYPGIRIDKLCLRLNVTKGSFYHHFKNVENYIEVLMEYWEEENTANLIKIVSESRDYEDELERLNQISMNIDFKAEVAIRSWAFHNEEVKKRIEKVDHRRLEYLKTLYTKIGVENDLASNYARLEYATYIGMQQLFADLPKKELDKLCEDYKVMLEFTFLPEKRADLLKRGLVK